MLKTLALGAAIGALLVGLAGAAEVDAKVGSTIVNPGTTSTNVAYPPICRWDPLRPRYCRRW
jgi:hypothetical protein